MMDGRKKKIIKEFGKNLKKLRTEKKLSLRELAAIAELEHAQLGRFELGEGNPTLTTIVIIAEALKIDPADLLLNIK